MLPTQVTYWAYKENQRHNLVAEAQGQQSIDESVRHNKTTEAQTDFYNTEMKRHNLASEEIGRTQAYASLLGAYAAQSQAAAAHRQAAAAETNARTNQFEAATRRTSQSITSFNETRRTSQNIRESQAKIAQGWVTSISRATDSFTNLVGVLSRME